MAGQEEIIISGPEYTGEEFLGSFAEFMIPKMKSHPKDSIIQVDMLTNETITCHNFLKTSLEIAEGFNKLGLKQGDVIVLAAPNSIRTHTTAMGVLFSGAILSPLEYNAKPLELQHMIKLLKPRYIVCEADKVKNFQIGMKAANVDAKIIILKSTDSNFDGDFDTIDDIKVKVDVDSYTPRSVSSEKNTLLIACSSGSTGYPKGVELSHYCLILNICLNENLKSHLQTSGLFWITGIMFLTMTIANGQPRYIPKSTSPEDILEGMEKFKPFFVMLPPAVLLNVIENPNFEKYNLDGVKLVLVGGASLGANVAEKVKQKLKGIALAQCYGMTEVGGVITRPEPMKNVRSVGSVTQEIKVKIVDVETGKSLGPNEVGELRFKSKRIMNGYYNNEEVTKASFDENGWFRTGDLLYYDEEGLFYVHGRIKEIIKYRNYQISPTEIEHFIISLPGVSEAAIVPIPHEEDTFHLKAVVVKSLNSDITAEDIIQSVKDNFSDYKHIRKGVEFVSSLPKTASNKLKRSELSKLYGST